MTTATSAATVALEVHKILPALHAQQNAPDDGEVVRIRRVDRDLRFRSAGKVVGGGVFLDVDEGDRPAARNITAHILQNSRRLKLPRGNGINHMLHLTLDDPSGQGIEGDLGLVTGAYALQRVLLEAGSKLLIVGVDEHHDGTERSGNDIHARPQRHLRHITRTWRPHHGLIEVVLCVAELGLQARDRGVDSTNL